MLSALLIGLLLGAPGPGGGGVVRSGTGSVRAAGSSIWKLPIIDDDANTTSHVTWNGTALVDSKSLAWTEAGTVTKTVRIGKTPPGATGFTDSNYINLGSGTDPLDYQLGNDFSLCVVYKVEAWTTAGHNATDSTLVGDGAYASQGYFIDLAAAYTRLYMSRAGVATSLDAQAATPLDTISVACIGRASETAFIKVNGKATQTGAWIASYVKGTGLPARIGRDSNSAGVWFIGTIYEVWASSTTPSDALLTTIQQNAKTRLGNPAW